MIKIENISKFIEFLQDDYKVFAPIKDGKTTAFGQLQNVDEICNDVLNTKKSPKNVFFPQAEVMFQYDENGIKTVEKNDKPIAIWGIRSCDVKSLRLMDKVFGNAHQQPQNKMYHDPYWKEKYDNSLIIGMACNEPNSTCFCHNFDDGPFSEKGSDIFAFDCKDYFVLKGISEKGKKVLANFKAEKFSETTEIEKLKKTAESYLSEKQDISKIKEKLDQIWHDPIWDEIARKCINCGACAFVCPSCHCFDVSDEGKDKKGQRIRIWDSCMFSIFTHEASGHNPRGLSTQRVRQRVMHKFNYFIDNYDEHLCTGCGRCVTVCPTNMDIREIVQKILNHKIEDKK